MMRCSMQLSGNILTRQHITFTEPQIQQNSSWLKWEIKREVFTTIFGLNDGYMVALENDPRASIKP